MPASARPASDTGTARRSSADDGLFDASIRLGRVAGVQIGLITRPPSSDSAGRMLHSALWHRTGDFSRATRIAGALGRSFGLAMVFRRAVVTADGRLVGLLSISDLSRLLELRRLTAGRDRGGHSAASG